MPDNKKPSYQVIAFMRIEPENQETKQEPMSFDEAKSLKEHFASMQPENIYKIEPIGHPALPEKEIRVTVEGLRELIPEYDGGAKTTEQELNDFIDFLELDSTDWIRENWRAFKSGKKE